MRNIFITGINGLLGTNLCHDLLHRGYHVKGFVRDKNRYKGKHHKNLEFIEGNIFDDFIPFLKNIDCVIHTAAITDQHLLKYPDYRKVNCDAAIQLYHAAIKCKVKRFIFVSTANTLGFGTLQDPGTETAEIKALFQRSFYAKSKLDAERHLLEHQHKIDTIIVHPTFMLGAYDTKPSSGKIIYMGWKKRIIFYPPGGKNFVHVKDVSAGIISAIQKGRPGAHYLLANENLSYREFFKKLNKITDQDPMMVKIPKPVLMAVGYIGNLLRTVNIKTSLSLTNMKILCIENYFSNNRSVIHLDITYQPIDNAISDAIAYFSTPKT